MAMSFSVAVNTVFHLFGSSGLSDIFNTISKLVGLPPSGAYDVAGILMLTGIDEFATGAVGTMSSLLISSAEAVIADCA